MPQPTRPIEFKLRKTARATFDAQNITSDAGLLLLRALDDRLGLTARLADALPDTPALSIAPLHNSWTEPLLTARDTKLPPRA